MTTVENLSLDDALARLEGPLESVRGLPSVAYNSAEFFALEHSRLFPGTWTFAGKASDIPSPGDRLPVTVAGQPLFVLRERDGNVRVFHNVCPHRGARIVPEPGAGRNIVCPYHAWTFDLDGSLIARPHYHGPEQHDRPHPDDSALPCLIEVNAHVWIDWIFVNLDGAAPPFDQTIEPLLNSWGEFDLSDLRFVHKLEVDYRCNWKLAIENYCDFYHVFKVHPDLNDSLAANRRTAMHCEGAILHNETWTHDTDSSISVRDDLPQLPHLGGRLRGDHRRTVFGVIFPNCAINVHRSDVQFSFFEPLNASETRLHRYFYFQGEAATHSDYAPVRQLIIEDWERVLREDEGVCQLIQEGRKSRAFDGGRLAPAWDEGTRHFHQLVASTLRGADDQGLM